jgi:hypothetical protein
MATIIQITGAALLVAGIGLLSVPVALIAAGLGTIIFGIALERK